MLKCDIVRRFPGFRLDVHLETQAQVLALFGPSGSGKSLTLQCIAGLLKPDAGTIQIGEACVFDAAARIDVPPRDRNVGYVFQNYALFPHLTAAQNVAYGLHRLPRQERAGRVQDALKSVQLHELADRLPAQLSGGQQQRVALARALVTRPSILLLDEPFAALDSIVRGELHHELVQLLRELGIPTLLVTHQLDEAYALSREIAVYEAGRVLQIGHRDEVYYQPRTQGVARLVGVGNFIPGRVADVTGRYTQVDGPGIALWGPPGPHAVGESVDCCIRPEHVMLLRKDREAPPAGPGETRIEGTIVEEVAYGGYVSLRFRPDPLPGGDRLPDLLIRLATYMQQRLDVGRETRQTVTLKAHYTHILKS
ncbi:MAG TPA: ABC transporter ATP-binding protein [Symbiobacteriaceae bacterium]|jgi:molybdate transport system ATP-binding protein